MATSLQVDYDEINSHLAMLLPYGSVVGDWTADQAANAARVRRRGLAGFYNNPRAYRWKFLRPELTIATDPAFATGSMTIVAGVATLAGGGQFPSWTASGWLYIGGIPYIVATRDSNTQLTLQDTSIAKPAGTAFTLRRYKYAMPTGFAGLVGPLSYAPHQSTRVIELKSTSEQTLRRYYQDQYWGTSDNGYPQRYAIVTDNYSATAGQTWSMIIWPSANAKYYVTGNYHLIPPDLDAVNKYPAGGPVHGQCVLEAILAEAELSVKGEYGEHRARFIELLDASITYDKEQGAPDTLGTIPSDSCTTDRHAAASNMWLVHEGFESHILP